MPPYLYRFRSIDALLGKHAELEAQGIYFATPKQLNDPMEGFKDLLWQGDAVLWRSLLRNYLHGVLMTVYVVHVAGDSFTPAMCENLVFQDFDQLPVAPIRDVYEEVRESFFANDVVKVLIETLGKARRRVRRDELAFYLFALHPLALRAAAAAFQARGTAVILPEIARTQLGYLDSLKNALGQYSAPQRAMDAMFEAAAATNSQVLLIDEFNSTRTAAQNALVFLVRDFPTFHVEHLERLVHPEWYAACFSADPTNASMWGGYADGHKGVCLKFATGPAADGAPSLELQQVVSIGGRTDDTRTQLGYRAMPFEQVRYGHEYPEIDFFTTLGTLPRPKLSRFWYGGIEGERSEIADRILGDNPEWRKAYWRTFKSTTLAKMTDWEHEMEYRLVLHSSFDQERCLKYKFSSLSGVCFGINTSIEDKVQIMRIIERKCLVEKRTNFEFLQARYSSRARKIEMVPLQLLKVSIE